MLSSLDQNRLDSLKNVVDYRRRNGEIMPGITQVQLEQLIEDLAQLHDLLSSMGREYELTRRDTMKHYDEFSTYANSKRM